MAKRSAKKRQIVIDRSDSPKQLNLQKLITTVIARNPQQKLALKSIHNNDITFLFGAPGTGKTAISVGYGIQELIKGKYEKLIFTRPAVEAGENLGFLPGRFEDKLAPYLMPMYDVLKDYLSSSELDELESNGKIITLPLAYQRGITFKKSFVIADESQNASVKQMHLLLTRLGEGSKIVVTGDVCQSDLRNDKDNGLIDAIRRLQGIDRISFVEFDYTANCRAEVISRVDQRYRKSSGYEEKILPQIMRDIDPNWEEPMLDKEVSNFDEYRDIQS